MSRLTLFGLSPLLVVALTACKGKPTLFDLEVLEAGADCAAGGVAMHTGVDDNKDGTLQPGEYDQSETVCNGEGASGGLPGQLLTTSDLPVGDDDCPGGGVRFDVGLDDGTPGGTAGDGILQSEEVDFSEAVCVPVTESFPSLEPPAGPAGQYTIDMSGGTGGAGHGGDGGFFDVEMDYGSLGGGIKIFDAGVADASFTFPASVSYDLGDNPVTVAASRTVKAVTTTVGLTTGDLFVLGTDTTLREWTGTTDEIVTGLSVSAGATLTVEPIAVWGYARLSLSSDFHLAGTLTTTLDGSGNRHALYLDADTFIGASTGAVSLAGANSTTGPGGAGGTFTLHASESDLSTAQSGGGVFNQASIVTTGGNGTDGGSAGGIYLEANLVVYNTGALSAGGGNGSSGRGGSGARIGLDSDYGSLYNSGSISASGGDGKNGGGEGGYAYFYNGYVGNVLNSGDITVDGGDATLCVVSECVAGDGGYVDFEMYASRFASTGDISARGGDATMDQSTRGFSGAYGGTGGYVEATNEYEDGWYQSSYVPPGDMRFSGDWDLSGGDGDHGGDGGYVDVEGDYDYVPDNQQILFLGYTDLDLSGGDGTIDGGHADYFWVLADYADSDMLDYGPGGPVVNYADVHLGGGDGATGSGGNGGYFDLFTEEEYGFWFDNEVAINHGDLDLTGGNGPDGGGEGGTAWIYGYGGAENHGAITCDGGDATGTDGWGGDVDVNDSEYSSEAGIFLWSDFGPVVNTGALSANGGSATGSESGGGDGGLIELVGATVDNSASLSSAGGAGTDFGGDGNGVFLLSLFGTTTQTGSAIEVGGGAGTEPGDDGLIFIDGMNVTGDW